MSEQHNTCFSRACCLYATKNGMDWTPPVGPRMIPALQFLLGLSWLPPHFPTFNSRLAHAWHGRLERRGGSGGRMPGGMARQTRLGWLLGSIAALFADKKECRFGPGRGAGLRSGTPAMCSACCKRPNVCSLWGGARGSVGTPPSGPCMADRDARLLWTPSVPFWCSAAEHSPAVAGIDRGGRCRPQRVRDHG